MDGSSKRPLLEIWGLRSIKISSFQPTGSHSKGRDQKSSSSKLITSIEGLKMHCMG